MTAATMKERFAAAENVSIWSIPDVSILTGGRRAPVPMPSGLFGSAWPLLMQIAEGTASPVDYPALAWLTTSASLIGGKRRVRPYATSPWSEPSILWAGLVGDPSSRKSPALDTVTDRLRHIERDGAEHHKEALREWQTTCERAKVEKSDWQTKVKEAVANGISTPPLPDNAVDPDEPQRRRTMVMDATPEAMASILSGNPAGTLHLRDELAGWLQSFDRYSPGGREFWLEAYGGRPFSVDRKGNKGPISIPFNGVSVLGGIQPAKLASALLSSPDDGLVARFLWAWPDKVAFRRPTTAANLDTLEGIYRRLEGLSWGRDSEGRETAITVPLSEGAATVFEQWQEANSKVDDDAGSLFKSFVGKMDGVVLRLALVAEFAAWAIRGGDEPGEVGFDALGDAADFVDAYAKPMAERVYGDAALPEVERNAAVLARYICKIGFTTINKRELKRSPHKSALSALREGQAMDGALAYLVDAGWLLDTGSRDGDSAGRRKGDYAVNPAVHGG
jgi:hypothetical protein